MDNQTNIGQTAAVSALPFAEAVRAGNLLFLSGQIGVGGVSGETGVSGQTEVGGMSGRIGVDDEVRQVMKNIGGVLQRHGLGFSHLVNVSIYLTDMSDYAAMNKVYSEFFQGGFPSRVCIAVRELAMQARVEISAIAFIP